MYATLLSLLMMGMLPVAGRSSQELLEPLATLPIASPAPENVLAPLEVHAGKLTASGIIIIDAATGQQVYAHNADVLRPIGSLTKLMTALLIVENRDLREYVKIPSVAAEVEGNTARLPIGHEFTVGELLSAMLIASANDAAETLAIYHSGSVEQFVAAMNARTVALGLRETSFGHPAGFDVGDHGSTPRELAWLLLHALRHDAIRTRLAQKGDVIQSRQGQKISLIHTHALLHRNGLPQGVNTLLAELGAHTPLPNPVVLAGKTGTTPQAMQCVVSLIQHAGHEYIVVILGSARRYDDLTTILKSFTGSRL